MTTGLHLKMIYLELLLLMWLVTLEHSILLASANKHPVQTYSQIRQMKTENISKFNNILAHADYSSILLADCPNYAYHSFMEMYTNAFNQACPVKSIKTPKNILIVY